MNKKYCFLVLLLLFSQLYSQTQQNNNLESILKNKQPQCCQTKNTNSSIEDINLTIYPLEKKYNDKDKGCKNCYCVKDDFSITLYNYFLISSDNSIHIIISRHYLNKKIFLLLQRFFFPAATLKQRSLWSNYYKETIVLQV